MSKGGAYQIFTRISQKLTERSKTSGKQLIFKIDQGLRKTNEMAYEPEILSIGPYHRGKNNLQKMEKYKLEYLDGILKRQNDQSSAERYIKALMQDEKEARSYYADPVSLSKDDFVEMMLLDGCFIIEFLRKYDKQPLEDDPIFKMSWILNVLLRDLLLFENQVPFFILDKLFEMTKIPNQEKDLISLAISCLNDIITVHTPIVESYGISNQPKNVFHLLSLMYEIWCSSFAGVIGKEGKDDRRLDLQNGVIGKKGKDDCRLELQRTGPVPCSYTSLKSRLSVKDEQEVPINIEFIQSVTELKKHGIELVKLEKSKSWLDVKLEDGEMKIPPLVIQDVTESVLRNLIAYEQYMFDLGHAGKFVTDYTTLMDCLINTAEDAKMLRHKEIIISYLGKDEAITDMFNNIGKNVQLVPPEFSYKILFKKVNEHCNKRRNSWIADLKSTYFKNPWSIISFVAATFLLWLTLIQTVVSILQLIN